MRCCLLVRQRLFPRARLLSRGEALWVLGPSLQGEMVSYEVNFFHCKAEVHSLQGQWVFSASFMLFFGQVKGLACIVRMYCNFFVGSRWQAILVFFWLCFRVMLWSGVRDRCTISDRVKLEPYLNETLNPCSSHFLLVFG